MGKFFVAVVVLAATAAFYTLDAQDEQPLPNSDSPEIHDSAVAQELIATLSQAYEQTVKDFALGQDDVHNAIRLNDKLYRAQLAQADTRQILSVIRNFIDRAIWIERYAEKHVAKGTGTQTAVLEAKASRLQGELDLEEFRSKFLNRATP